MGWIKYSVFCNTHSGIRLARYLIVLGLKHQHVISNSNISHSDLLSIWMTFQVHNVCIMLTVICLFFCNPFTAPACTISGLNDTRKRLQTVYFPVLLHLFSMLCGVLMEFLSHASPKRRKKEKKKKRFKGFKFRTFMGRFQMTSWQWRG